MSPSEKVRLGDVLFQGIDEGLQLGSGCFRSLAVKLQLHHRIHGKHRPHRLRLLLAAAGQQAQVQQCHQDPFHPLTSSFFL